VLCEILLDLLLQPPARVLLLLLRPLPLTFPFLLLLLILSHLLLLFERFDCHCHL
jgi:hypothetical protein